MDDQPEATVSDRPLPTEALNPVKEKRRLERQIEALPGYRLAQESERLGISYRLLSRNAQELGGSLESFTDPNVALPLLDLGNQEAFTISLEEVGRYLHNYLASAKTLVDHTRNVVRQVWPPNSPFLTHAYEPRLSELFGAPEAVFLQNLRDYAVHYRRLPLTCRTQGSPSTFDNAVVLSVAELNQWSGWKKAAKEFLDSQTDAQLAISPIVWSYQRSVERFYDWFGPALVQEHLEQFAELERAQQEYGNFIAALNLTPYD
jgi:hypothetical protein